MGSIEDVFDTLGIELENYYNTALRMFATEAIKTLAEAWAYLIIDLLTSSSLPALADSTIYRRVSRNQSLISPESPLLETGKWITYIEFRVRAEYDLYYVEVGVWDDSTGIGHTKDATPAWIATVNEYGLLNLPVRAPFATTELQIQPLFDNIITSAWRKVSVDMNLDKTVSAIVTRNMTAAYGDFHMVGRIVSDGSNFKFKWDG